MSNLSSLAKYFKGGSAEAERDIRGEIFVPPTDVSDLMAFDFHPSVILLGNKGVGKSIFVSVLHEAYLKNNELSVLLTPDDLECDTILDKRTLADRKSAAYAQMLKAIAGIIGRHSQATEMAISSDVAALQNLAVNEGYSKADVVTKFAKIAAKALPSGAKFAQGLLEEQSRVLAKNNLTDIVNDYLTDRNSNIWLFVDDIDAAVSQGSKGEFDYAACWAIVSAALDLAQDISSLKCVVSVRSDIWHLMTRTHRHGIERRDKLGHIHELKFSEEELRAIFNKRISLAGRDAKSNSGIWDFFQQHNVTLPGETGQRRSWDQWLSKIARNRPRDLVKAVQMLISSARKSSGDVIGNEQAHSILYEYGRERVANIIDEYGQICPQIEEAVNDLTGKHTYSFLEIMEILEKSPARRAMQIDGVALKQTKEDAIKILRLLHMACFINPRIDAGDEYKHYNYQDYPDLVDLAKFNELQKYSWQVHPTFYSYAEEIKKRKRFSSW